MNNNDKDFSVITVCDNEKNVVNSFMKHGIPKNSIEIKKYENLSIVSSKSDERNIEKIFAETVV